MVAVVTHQTDLGRGDDARQGVAQIVTQDRREGLVEVNRALELGDGVEPRHRRRDVARDRLRELDVLRAKPARALVIEHEFADQLTRSNQWNECQRPYPFAPKEGRNEAIAGSRSTLGTTMGSGCCVSRFHGECPSVPAR